MFGLEVESSREVLEVLVKISNVAVAEMLLTHCLNVLEGEVPDVYVSCLNEIVKVVPIRFPPILCFFCCLGWHLVEMGRPDCVVCGYLENDDFTTKITNNGAKSCTNRFGCQIAIRTMAEICTRSIGIRENHTDQNYLYNDRDLYKNFTKLFGSQMTPLFVTKFVPNNCPPQVFQGAY
jgi:hypothetical protein